MITYISGPITGKPDLNHPLFFATEEHLLGNGIHVLNPARIKGDDSWAWERWMKAALTMQMQADAIYMLPGWQKSRGAQLEHQVATATGMRIYGARA